MKFKRKVQIKRGELFRWWSRQRVLPVILGVYFGLMLVIATNSIL